MTLRLPEAILSQRVIAVARGQDPSSVVVLAEALMAGGIEVLEVTLEGENGLGAIAALAGAGATVGAGTVTTVEQAAAAVEAGASFLVSPHLDPELVGWAVGRGVPIVPGALTPTEVHAASILGVPAVKIFPASVVGPEMVKALLGPFPAASLIPTGGVQAGNARAYLDAGAVAVGVGGWLTGHRDPGLTRERARELVQAIS